MRAKQIPRAVKDIVRGRSRGTCEKCGEANAVHFHHRRPRGMGGSREELTNRASNLLHLCMPCHNWIELNRLAALDEGWLVKQGADPAQVSVSIRNGRWRLDDNGQVLPLAYGEWREIRACTRKSAFKDKGLAVRWARANAWRGYDTQSAYQCEHCGNYHLTTKEVDA